MKKEDVPPLEPMWGDDKGETRSKIYNFLNQQNIRIVKQIEPNSVYKIREETGGGSMQLV